MKEKKDREDDALNVTLAAVKKVSHLCWWKCRRKVKFQQPDGQNEWHRWDDVIKF